MGRIYKKKNGAMRIKLLQLRRIIREALDEEQERSELDKIKEVFASGGAQAIELADMVGLGDDPAVYEMKEIVKIIIEALDAITDESFNGVEEFTKHDMAHRVWWPLAKKGLGEIYHPANSQWNSNWNDQFEVIYADISKLMRVYWGGSGYSAEETASVIENLADWAGHPVEMPK
jgi:hypothetical protein